MTQTKEVVMTRKLYAALSFADAERAAELLKTFGFTEMLTVRNEADPTRVEHAQYAWNDGAGVMWASPDPERGWRRPGTGNVYLSVESDAAVDELHARLVAFGCESVEEPNDADYGGRSAGVRDSEGNLWSFGTYAGVSE